MIEVVQKLASDTVVVLPGLLEANCTASFSLSQFVISPVLLHLDPISGKIELLNLLSKTSLVRPDNSPQ